MRERDMDYETNRRPRVKVVKKGSFFGKLLAVFLGFLLGIISCLGGIVGIGYYVVGVMKIEDGAETVNGFGLDFDYTDYISANFGDKTLIDYLTAVTGVFGEIAEGTGTLNDLNELSPYVKTLLAGDPSVSAAQGEFNGILPMLESLGLVLDVDEFMSKILVGGGGETPDPTKYLTDYVMEETYKLPVGDLLSLAGMNPEGLIATLFYGEKGIDWEEDANGKIVPVEGGTPWVTISDVMSGAISERISSIPIYTVMEPEDKSDALMMSLVYGSSNRYTVKDNEVEMNQQSYTKDGDIFYDDTDKAVAATAEQQTDGSYKLTFAESGKVQYVKAETQTFAASNAQTKWLVYSDKECTAPVKYRAKTLNDFTNSDGLLNSLTIADVLKVNAESNKIIISLAYGTLHEDYEIVKVNGVDTIQTLNGAKPRTLNDLTDTQKDIIGQIRLADVMDIDTQSNVMMYLMYGVKGVHFKLENDKPVPLTKQMVILEDNGNKIAYNEYGDETLKGTTDGVTYVEDGVTYYLAPVMVEGENGETQRMVDVRITANNKTEKISSKAYYLYEDQAKTTPVLFKPTKLMTLMDDHVFISGLTGRLTLEQTMGIISKDSPLYALKDVIVDDLPDEIDSLKIKDLFDEDDLEKNNILDALKESSLETLADDINDLPIADMFDETVFQKDHNDYNPILNALKTRGATITNLPEKIDLITIGEMFTEDDLKKSKILNALSGSTLDTMADDVNNLAVEKLFDDKYFDPDHADYNPIFKALKDKQATVTNLPEKIDDLTIGDMFKPEDLAKNDLLDALEGSTLDTLSDDINNLSIRDMFDDNVFNPEHEDYNKILSALANNNATFDTLSDKINELKFSDVYDADEIYKTDENGNFLDKGGTITTDPTKYVAENPVLGYLYESDKAITELTEAVDEMTVKDVFHEDDINANPLLKTLADKEVPVKSLGEEINKLTVGEVFEDSIYKTDSEGKFVLDGDGNKIVESQILWALRDEKITDMGDAVNNLTLKGVFTDKEIQDNPILRALDKREIKINQMGDVINELTVGEVFEDSIYKTDENGEFVLDGEGNKIVESQILWALRDSKINEMGTAVNELYVKDVLPKDQIEGSPILKALVEKEPPVKVNQLGDCVDDLTIGDIYGDLIYVKDAETGEWATDESGELLISTNANHVLATLHDTKIVDLDTRMDSFTVGDMFVHEIYMEEIKADGSTDNYHFVKDESELKGYKVDPDANPILVHLRDTRVDKMSEAVAELTVRQIFEKEMFETKVDQLTGETYFIDENGVKTEDPNKYVLKGSWYYLLKETRPDHPKYNSVHYEYKLTDEMDDMINNMIKNMPKAELWELHEKKIIDLSAHDELLSEGDSGKIAYLPAAKKYYFPADHEDEDKRGQVKTHFRYLTVSELLGYVGDIIHVVRP